jgi:predicted nucleotidyltransferase
MKNRLGLFEADLQNVVSVLTQFPEVEYASIFGSRAKGNYKNGSDVDIALKGKQLSFMILAQINSILNEETSMPYRFDVLNYETITNNELKEHIDRVGLVIYHKNNASISVE